jgi:hypothetical protein
MTINRNRDADPFMAVKWETMRVRYFTANKHGNEQALEDAEFQLDRWKTELNKQLGGSYV